MEIKRRDTKKVWVGNVPVGGNAPIPIQSMAKVPVWDISQAVRQIKEMEEAKDKSAKSIEIAARLIKELRPLCNGIHIMPIGWDKKVPLVLDAAGL